MMTQRASDNWSGAYLELCEMVAKKRSSSLGDATSGHSNATSMLVDDVADVHDDAAGAALGENAADDGALVEANASTNRGKHRGRSDLTALLNSPSPLDS